MGFNAAEVERTARERVCKTGVEYDSVEALISDLTRAESESDETQDKEGRTFTKVSLLFLFFLLYLSCISGNPMNLSKSSVIDVDLFIVMQ